jgi:hypothetical protein
VNASLHSFSMMKKQARLKISLEAGKKIGGRAVGEAGV